MDIFNQVHSNCILDALAEKIADDIIREENRAAWELVEL